MKKCAIALISLLMVNHIFGQGVFERLPSELGQQAVLVLGYRGNMEIVGFGSGAIYGIPVSTNNYAGPNILSIVTAMHVLSNQTTGTLFDGLLVKINMPTEKPPRYLKIPLIHDTQTNYWTSPSGLDLAVIPIPPNSIDGATTARFGEDQILTPERAKEKEVVNGM
jgi:hypothetical protein